MARELFKPWAYSRLEQQGHVTTIKEAKKRVEGDDPLGAAAISEVATGYPVVLFPLNARAPGQVLSLDVEAATTSMREGPGSSQVPRALPRSLMCQRPSSET